MKTSGKIAAAFVLAFVAVAFYSCKEKTVLPKTAEEFENMIGDMNNEAFDAYDLLTDDAAREEFAAEYTKKLVGFCTKVIKANPDQDFAVDALRMIGDDLDDSHFAKAVASLSKEKQEDPQLKAMQERRDALKATAEGRMFTDFEIDGVKFSDFIGKGKYVLVDFWASWCKPCRGEIPNIKAVYEKYAGEKFDVLSVAVWDDPKNTVVAAEEEGIAWNQIINAQKVPTTIYGINGIPQIMLFGPDGTIVKRDLRGSDIEKAVKEALGL